MANPLIRHRPLNILVVLSGPDPSCTAMLSAFRSHCALVCESSHQAVEAVRNGFAPDATLIDTRLPDAGELARVLAGSLPDHDVTFIALCPRPAGPVPPGFTFRLAHPAAASELEHLLWLVGGARDARAAEKRIGQPVKGIG
jgi:hypothetical protein